MAAKWNPTTEQLLDAKNRLATEPGLSQRKLAAELGVDQASLSRHLARFALGDKPDAPAAPVVLIAHAHLRPDPGNPRRTFADESLDDLAATIESQGLLQNLLVKPAGEDGVHEITSGERRWRAIGRLIEQGRWQGDIPCQVKGGDAAQQLARAIIENLQREDVAPLEEAEAFARLQEMDPERFSGAVIATMIGKTARFVQQRIALARKLHPAAKRLLEHNRITIEACRQLAALDEAEQAEVIENASYLDSVDTLLTAEGLDEVEAIATEEIEGEIQYLRNRKEAKARAAEQNTRAAEDAAAAAEDDEGDDETADAPVRPARAEALNVLDDPVALPLPEPAGPAVTKNHVYHAHRRKSLALRNAVALDHLRAIRLTCLALLTRQASVMISPRSFHSDAVRDDDPGELLGIEVAIEKIVGKVEPFALSDKAQVKLWHKIAAVDEYDLYRLYANLVARHIVSPAGYDCSWGDTSLSIAIAKSLDVAGNEAAHGLSVAREDLAGIRKPALLALADEVAAPGVNDDTKTADIIDAITTTRTSYVLPTLRFASTEQIEKSLKEIGK